MGALPVLFAIDLERRRLWAYAFGLLFLGLSAPAQEAAADSAATPAASWISVVYAGRTAGAASIRANAALVEPTAKPRLFSLLGVWRYDVTSRAWRRLVTSKLQKQVEIPRRRQVRSQDPDQVLYALPRAAGLYWVEWMEDAHRASSFAFSGPILCNDVMIGEAPTGMIATCVPFPNHAEAMFVPDPKVATALAVIFPAATADLAAAAPDRTVQVVTSTRDEAQGSSHGG